MIGMERNPMRLIHNLLATALMLASLSPARADSTLDYRVGGGRTSNLFRDTTRLPASFAEGAVTLRGSFDLEETDVAYAMTTRIRQVPRYRFADERAAGFEAGLTRDFGDTIRFTLRGSMEHRRSGDILLSVPGLLIGYRQEDVLANASTGLAFEFAGGKSHLSASLARFAPGKVKFTLPGLPRARLESANTLYELTGGHIRPFFGGETGATLQLRTNHIPGGPQDIFERYRARTLRGSLAYGHAFGPLTLLAEAGLVRVESPDLGKSVDPTRPFLKAELAWAVNEDIVLRGKLSRDIQLADIDDPLGEDVRTFSLSAETALTEKLKFNLAFEQAYSDWLYYDYRTRTASTTATLRYTLAKGAVVALEYSHLIRKETDKTADFKVNGLAARLEGSF